MSFFQKLGNALSRFMYGRNGTDQLGWASLVLLLVLNTVNLFVKYSSEPTAARKEPIIKVALITLFIFMPISWLVSKSLDTARMAMPIFVF